MLLSSKYSSRLHIDMFAYTMFVPIVVCMYVGFIAKFEVVVC